MFFIDRKIEFLVFRDAFRLIDFVCEIGACLKTFRNVRFPYTSISSVREVQERAELCLEHVEFGFYCTKSCK